MSEFRKGDRVRITRVLEGEVEDAGQAGVWINGYFYSEEQPRWTQTVEKLEKLVPPEPKWIMGDLVKAPGYVPTFMTFAKGWVGAGSGMPVGPGIVEAIQKAWQDGTLEILHKMD